MRAHHSSRATTRGHGGDPTTVRGAALLGVLVLLALPGAALAAGDLVLFPKPPMLIALVALFFLLVLPMNALIFKPIFRALDERAHRIAGARHRAERVSAEADAVLARYQEAIREARAAAETSRKQLIEGARSEQASIAGSARRDAEALVEQARSELGSALGEARTGLRASANELARLAAERILGRAI